MPPSKRDTKFVPLQKGRGLILTYGMEGKKVIGGKKITIMPVWKWLLGSKDAP